MVLGTEDDADGNNVKVDLQNLASTKLLLEDDAFVLTDGNDFSSGDFFAQRGFENPSRDGTDLSLGEVSLTICGNDVFHLAETETFAQVTEDGAFAFSESLAARSGTVTDIADIL